jgi:hypothetical protein
MQDTGHWTEQRVGEYRLVDVWVEHAEHWTEQRVGEYRLVDGRVEHAEHWTLDGTDS